MTPFEEFYHGVRELADSDVSRNLRQFFSDHPIYGPLERLHNATSDVRAQYGKEGPATSWNQPCRSAGSTFSGSTHSNFSRPSTPSHNNGGLHPNWPHTPPSSRPGSYSGLHEISKLQAENQSLRDENRSLKNENESIKDAIAATNRSNLELETLIAQHETTIERVRSRCAALYLQTKQYGSAASDYEQLASLKKNQRDAKAILRDEEGSRAAEDGEVCYTFQQAKALASGELHEQADRIFRVVLAAKHKLGSQRAMSVDLRDVQTQLCDSLDRQNKRSEAKKLYLEAAAPLQLGALERRSREDCTWVLRNAISYAHIVVKERDYDQARPWLKLIWSNRYRATQQGLRVIETRMLDVLSILESRADSRQQMKLLETVCSGNQGVMSAQVLVCYSKFGMIHYDNGKSKIGDAAHQDYASAVTCLQQAWSRRQQLDTNASRSTGWTLALSLLHLDQYENARDVLQELEQNTTNNTRGSHPSKDQTMALLAYTQLKLRDFAGAETTAATVYNNCGVNNISTASTIDLSAHHADTLILACSKQKTREKFEVAEKVWNAIQVSAKDTLREVSGRTQLTQHISSATVLADEWQALARRRGPNVEPTSAKRIREGIRKMKALMK